MLNNERMKKNNKRFTSKIVSLSLLSLALIVLLSSCKLSDMFGKAGITMPETVSTHPPESQTSPQTDTQTPSLYPPMDFSSVDLKQYMNLNYKGINLTTSIQKREITDSILHEELYYLMVKSGNYTLSSERKTAQGDWIEISYVGYMDGETFSGGSSEKATILLDEQKSGYISGFATGLIGAEPGMTMELKLQFPDNYYAELAGKPVTFMTEIKGICEYSLTDETAASLSDGAANTVDEFKVYFRQYLSELEDAQVLSDVYESIWPALSALADITIYPSQQVDHYYNELRNSALSYAQQNNIDYETFLSQSGYTDEDLRQMAKDKTKNDMILYYIANEESIELSDNAYQKYVQEMVDRYNNQGYTYSSEQIISLYEQTYGKDYLRMCCYEEKICTAVYHYSTVTYKPETETSEETTAVQ